MVRVKIITCSNSITLGKTMPFAKKQLYADPTLQLVRYSMISKACFVNPHISKGRTAVLLSARGKHIAMQ